MAQEDKGLVIRGLVLMAIIGCLVAFVLAILFWRTEPAPTVQTPPEHYVASAPGWEIRYNAAATLARRGSTSTPWPLVREMLDEKQQLVNARVQEPDGKEVYDEAVARATTIAALRALAAWHEQRKADATPKAPAELRAIYAVVDQLAASSYGEVKNQAEKARATFFR
jgi:hypothetical protein